VFRVRPPKVGQEQIRFGPKGFLSIRVACQACLLSQTARQLGDKLCATIGGARDLQFLATVPLDGRVISALTELLEDSFVLGRVRARTHRQDAECAEKSKQPRH
jgi:hypothetical protein